MIISYYLIGYVVQIPRMQWKKKNQNMENFEGSDVFIMIIIIIIIIIIITEK